MPTKDELTVENAELRAQIDELREEVMAANENAATPTFGDVTYEDGVYVYTDGIGFTQVTTEAGTFVYDGDGAKTITVETVKPGELHEVVDAEGHTLTDGSFYQLIGGEGLVKLDLSLEPLKDASERGPRIRDANGEFAEPVADALYRYDGSGDMVMYAPVEGGEAALRSELTIVQMQRDEARNEAARLRQQIKDAGTLHGSIDSLKPVY